MLGQPQNPLFLFKCSFGDLVTYGLGGKKKSAKNNSASRMLRKLNLNLQKENVDIQRENMPKWQGVEGDEKVQRVLNTDDNAISILESIDKIRFQRTLKFTEIPHQIGIQTLFTVECKLLLMPDLNVKHVDPKNCFKKGDCEYLKTSSRTTKKKTSKTEAAEMMVNLLKGNGAYTNEQVEMNKQLQEFEESLNAKKDVIEKDKISRDYQAILTKMIRAAIEFMADKPKYDEDYDFLAEVKQLVAFVSKVCFCFSFCTNR